MTKTLILTPNKTEMCGMYQLAKDLAKEFDGDIMFKGDKIGTGGYYDDFSGKSITDYKQVITFLYPMHKHGKFFKSYCGMKWVCYDQKIPPVTKTYFPNFWRRQYMKVFTWLNNRSMKGADEYWDVTEREQKPRWTEKKELNDELKKFISMLYGINLNKPYAIYLGRTTDYKNFDWLKKLLENFSIPLLHPLGMSDENINILLSNAKMLVTASIWEGYGRPVMEAEALGIPAIAYDIGAHKRHIKKGICVTFNINNLEKSEKKFEEAVLEVWNGKSQRL